MGLSLPLQPFHMRGNLACGGQPNVAALARNMSQSAAQMAQAMWLADNIGVQCNAHDQRLMGALLQHLVKMVDYHLGEGGPFDFTRHNHRNIIDFLRVGH